MALNSLFCADVPLSNYSLTHSVILLLDRFLPQTKDIPVPPIIYRHFAVTIHPHIDFAFMDFGMNPVILATLKIPIWLIDVRVSLVVQASSCVVRCRLLRQLSPDRTGTTDGSRFQRKVCLYVRLSISLLVCVHVCVFFFTVSSVFTVCKKYTLCHKKT